MKKKLIPIAVAVLIFAMSAMPVFAKGGQGGQCKKQCETYSVCTTNSCEITGLHIHNGKSYTAHYYGDGHTYHAYCAAEDCSIVGYHEHDGTYCFGHTVNDGHNYHAYCGLANCTLTGYHEHNGVYCFAHTLNDGHGHHGTCIVHN